MPRRAQSHSSSASYSEPSTFTDGLPLPRMFVFDLDYTLWPFWADTHVTPPLTPGGDGTHATDAYGTRLAFYPSVPGLLSSAQSRSILLSAASRTDAPDIARTLLSTLHIPRGPSASLPSASTTAVPARAAFQGRVHIAPGSKIGHVRALSRDSGLPLEEMVLFDDEARNADVERVGVVMASVSAGEGLTARAVDDGVWKWRSRWGRSAPVESMGGAGDAGGGGGGGE